MYKIILTLALIFFISGCSSEKKESMKKMAAYDELIISSREENLKMLGKSEKSYNSSLERLDSKERRLI